MPLQQQHDNSGLPAPVTSGGASTESMVAAALGIGGAVLTTFSCCCGLLMLLSVPMGLGGLVLGYLERAKVQRGEIDRASETYAIVGMAGGGLTMLIAMVALLALFVGLGGGALQKYLARFANR